MNGTIAPIRYTVVADGIQYIAFFIPKIGYYFIVRKTFRPAETRFEYGPAYEGEGLFEAAWTARTTIDFGPSINVDASLAPLFNNFGGVPTMVQSTTTSSATAQHVIVDNELSEPVPVYITNAAVSAGGSVTPMTLTNAELRAAPVVVHQDNPVTSVGITGPVAVTGGLTNAELRQAPLAVRQDGPLALSGPVAIEGTVPVSGPLTDRELRASRVPVDVAFPATQPVSLTAAPLPAGAATAQAQATIQAGITAVAADIAQVKAQTAQLDVALSTRTKPADVQKVDGSATTQPVSAASLPLPGGAATESTLALVKAAVTTPALPAGSATAGAQAAQQAALDAIKASVAVSGTEATLQLIKAAVASPALPSGAATAALQASLNGLVGTESTLQLLRALLTTGNGYLQTMAGTTPGPKTSGGTVTTTVLSAAGANATSLKKSTGQVYSVSAHNSSSSWRYVQLFDTAAVPPSGAAPAIVIGIPPNSARDVQFAFGAPFAVGIGYTITAKAGLLDLLSTVLAGEVGINIAYV